MCTNQALVNSLECYMDDLVDCFEDFVKKSLILISVGAASVVFILVYMLKVITDRTGTPDAATDPRGLSTQQCRDTTSIQTTATPFKRNIVKRDFMLCCEPKLTSTSVNTLPISPAPSIDERLLKDISYSNCNQNCDLKTRDTPIDSLPRRSITSLPTCLPKQQSSPRKCVKVLKRTSCCSMCCDDDKI